MLFPDDGIFIEETRDRINDKEEFWREVLESIVKLNRTKTEYVDF